jgi:23S rRNA (adenine2503-C2)-methyltransferase
MTFVFQKGVTIISALQDELAGFAEAAGEPAFRGQQIFEWLHGKGIIDPGAMTNLPLSMRSALASMDLSWPVRAGRVLTSDDGTRKVEVHLAGGGTVETVLIPEGAKLTQCVSTQLGCAVGCRFCRSGSRGLTRNLTAAEILGQIHLGREALTADEKLRNIVFMGVGEPLHNLSAVTRAMAIIEHPRGLDLSSRRITVSTVGFARGIDRLAEATKGNAALAVSLHAADDATRRALVPGVSDSLEDIVAALARYPMPKRRRITVEYVLIDQVNDSEAAARKLVALLNPLRVKVNLLPLNPHDRTELWPPSDERVARFQRVLIDHGVSVFLRKRRGDDISAACGQLLATT